MSLPDPSSKHNAEMRRRLAQMREALKEGLQLQLFMLKRKALKRMPQADKEQLYESYYTEYHSELADREIKELLNQLMARVCPEKLLLVESETVNESGDQSLESLDPQESWEQEHQHRPPPHDAAPPRQPANPSPFIDHVVCLHCEKFLYGQLLLRTTICPLCRKGRLMPVGSWNMSNDAFYPFHPEGGAA